MKKRTIQRQGDVALVPLTKGQTAIIDISDIPLIEQYNWHAKKDERANVWYARTDVGRGIHRQRFSMHRLILGISNSEIKGDHIDGDGLNNRRSNLRISTTQQNAFNSRKSKNRSSIYKGVSLKGRYYAQISCGGVRFSLGYFDSEIDAAKAYDAKAKELHGEFASLNFPK